MNFFSINNKAALSPIMVFFMAILASLLITIEPYAAILIFLLIPSFFFAIAKPKTMLWIAIGSCPFANIFVLDIMDMHIRLVQFLWLFIVIVFLAKGIFQHKTLKIEPTLINFSLALYVLFNLISVLVSVAPKTSLVDSLQIFGLAVIFFLLVSQLKTEEDITIAAKILLSSGLILIISGLFQYIFGVTPIPQITLGNGITINYVGRLNEFSTFYGVNYLRTNSLYFGTVATGCYTAQLLLIAIFSNKYFPKIYFTLIPLGLFLLFVTYSRASIFSFIILILLIGTFNAKYRFYSLIFILIIIPIVIITPVFSRLMESFNIEASSNAQHLIIYLKAIGLFLDKPLFGWGSGTATSLIGAGGFVNVYGLKAFLTEKAAVHNIFLQTAAETGLFGLIGIGLFIATFLWKGFSVLKFNCAGKPLVIGLIAASFCGILVVQISNFFYREAFWVFLGVTWAAIKSKSINPDATEPEPR